MGGRSSLPLSHPSPSNKSVVSVQSRGSTHFNGSVFGVPSDPRRAVDRDYDDRDDRDDRDSDGDDTVRDDATTSTRDVKDTNVMEMLGQGPPREDDHVLTSKNVLMTSPAYDIHRVLMTAIEVRRCGEMNALSARRADRAIVVVLRSAPQCTRHGHWVVARHSSPKQ